MKQRKLITYQRLLDIAKDIRIARKSLEFDLPHVLPFDENFDAYKWKVFLNTPRNLKKVFAE